MALKRKLSTEGGNAFFLFRAGIGEALPSSAQGRDSLLQRGMGHKQASNSTTTAAGNAKCSELVGEVGLRHRSTQRLQGRDHVLTARQTRAALVGSEFPNFPTHASFSRAAFQPVNEDSWLLPRLS